jgi:coenzyme F420-reducing hydrogenase gamma subunit
MDVRIFQFNGCNKCFNETLLLKEDSEYSIKFVSDTKSWKEEKIDVSIIAGYLVPDDLKSLNKIKANSEKVIAYGNCAATGGVFALANQKGHEVTPLQNLIGDSKNIKGCLGEIKELKLAIDGKEVNDLGFLCSGFIAKECKEKCIDYNTPCRGCKPSVDRSGIRMLGLFGTLAGNVEIATEHSVKGATDKLADENDDLTDSLPDIVGNFFRFTLPTSGLPKGRIPSSGTLLEDVFIGRLIEEIPLISGILGGSKSISLTLKFIESYEKANEIKVSEQVKKFRSELLKLEDELQNAIEKEDSTKYKEVTEKIRKIAGNMNLSNLYDNFDDYKTHIFEIVEGTYKNGSVEYKIDSDGILTEIKIKEGLV